jgi:iron(III) transport system substrate-binding protein
MPVRYLAALGLAAACFWTPSSSSAADVSFYSSANSESIETVVKGFKQKHPQVNVSVVRAGTGSLMQRIKAESANPRADVFWSGGLGTLAAFRDYFAPYQSPHASAFPANLRGPDNLWLGVNTHVTVFLVNKKALRGEPVPQTWGELFSPKWKDRIIMSNPEQSSSSYEQIWGINHLFGQPGLEAIAKNVTAVSTSSAVTQGVARGEFPVAITLEYLAHEYIAASAEDIEIVYPKDGIFVSYIGVVLIKDAKNLEDGKRLYDFIASKEGQELVLVNNFRRPARTDVDVAKLSKLPDLSSMKITEIDEAKAGADYQTLLPAWKKLAAR